MDSTNANDVAQGVLDRYRSRVIDMHAGDPRPHPPSSDRKYFDCHRRNLVVVMMITASVGSRRNRFLADALTRLGDHVGDT